MKCLKYLKIGLCLNSVRDDDVHRSSWKILSAITVNILI